LPSTQSGAPSSAALKDRIDQPGDPLRLALAGQMLEALSLQHIGHNKFEMVRTRLSAVRTTLRGLPL
jgi:hypothetical protein